MIIRNLPKIARLLAFCCLVTPYSPGVLQSVAAQPLTLTLAEQLKVCPTSPSSVWTAALSVCLAGRYEGVTPNADVCTLTIRANGSAVYQTRLVEIGYSMGPETPFRYQRLPLAIASGGLTSVGSGFSITTTAADQLQVEAWPVRRTAAGAADVQRCDIRHYTRLAPRGSPLVGPMPGNIIACFKTRLDQWSTAMATCVAGQYTGRRSDNETCSLAVYRNGEIAYRSRNRTIAIPFASNLPMAWVPNETRWTVGGPKIDGPGLSLSKKTNGSLVLDVWPQLRDAAGAVTNDTCFIDSYLPLTVPLTAPSVSTEAPPAPPLVLAPSEPILAPVALPSNLPSGWVLRRATYEWSPNRAMFELDFRRCITMAQSMALSLNQPYTPPVMPLSPEQLASLDTFVEFDAYDANARAARYEKVGPHTARINVGEAIRGATLTLIPNCTNVQYQLPKSATIWSRDGKIYDLRYVDDRPPTLFGGRPVGQPRQTAVGAAKAASAEAPQARQVAGQPCLEQPAMQFMGARTICLWEPFAQIKYHNLPIALEVGLSQGGLSVRSIAERAELTGGPWRAPIGSIEQIDEIPANAVAAPVRSKNLIPVQ
jgi:hypothetical protein